MLIISRKKDEKIIVADEIEITILEVGRNRVRFGIKAPKHIPIQTRMTPGPELVEPPLQSTHSIEEVEIPMRAMPAVAGGGMRR